MSAAPTLTANDVQLEIERIFSKERRSFLTALYGSGEAANVSARGRKWQVIPTRCELELRAKMPEPGRGNGGGDGSDHDRGTVFLVDWTERPLPLDLACRLAAGRVFRITRGTLLAARFGARRAEAGLMGTALAEVLLGDEIEGLKKVSGPVLSRADAYRRFLDAWLDLPLAGELTAPAVAAWGAVSDAGPGFVRRGEESEPWRRLRAEIADFVAGEAGPLAALAWTAWERGLGARFLELAVLIDAHHRQADPVAEGVLQGVLAELGPGFGQELLGERDALAESGLLDDSLRLLAGDRRRRLLEEADGLISVVAFETTREASPWLPSGHRRREARLGSALADCVEARSAEGLGTVKAALEDLEGHHLDAALRSEEQRETRWMAARLAGYLVARHQAPPPPATAAAYQQAVDLAKDYAAEGGFVDWCRQRLRAPLPFGDSLNTAVHGVLQAADALRREDNRRFAEGLIRWAEAGRPAAEVTPIDRALGQLAVELLDGHPERKLLVVLMDGMSWTAAVQILRRLDREKWAPIVWRPKGHRARPRLPPVLADLPTLTPVSRAAFFAGRRDKSAGSRPTGDDTARWAAHRGLARLASASGDPAADKAELPPLVMRGKLMDGEALHADVKKAVDSDAPVVGVVVNAIDEQLKGSTQVVQDYTHSSITPLVGLLTAASGAERVVLLASDHGHVPGDAMTSCGRPTPRRYETRLRWRALGAGDEMHEHEIRLPADTWKPRGSQGVAAIWDEQVSNGQPTNYGTHGGVALAEVVAPAVLIAPDWLAQIQGEDGSDLETRPFPEPGWWELETAAAAAAPMPSERGEEKPPPETIPLFPELFPEVGPAEKPERAESEPRAEPPLIEALRASKIWKTHVQDQRPAEVERVLAWLAVLVEAGGSLPEREFARRCQERPHRVAGLVACMGLLNCDGYAMVEHDPGARQVVLHTSRLVQNYGLSP